MIGRGTRLRKDLFGPGDDKKEFLIFDYLGNMEYFRVNKNAEKSGIIESLSQRIYKLRRTYFMHLNRMQQTRIMLMKSTNRSKKCQTIFKHSMKIVLM